MIFYFKNKNTNNDYYLIIILLCIVFYLIYLLSVEESRVNKNISSFYIFISII